MLVNLTDALNGMIDDDLIPSPPEPVVSTPWEPTVAQLAYIIGLMRQAVNAGWTRQQIRAELVTRAREQYSKTLTRRMVDEIWEAWQAEITERQAAQS